MNAEKAGSGVGRRKGDMLDTNGGIIRNLATTCHDGETY